MSEASFSLTIKSKCAIKGINVVKVYKEISVNDYTELEIKELLTENIGSKFVSILERPLETNEDLKNLYSFFPKNTNIEWAWSMANIYCKKEGRRWIEDESGQINAWDIVPDYICINIDDTKPEKERCTLEFDYGFTDVGPIKVAVFSNAFTSAGFNIGKNSTWSDEEE